VQCAVAVQKAVERENGSRPADEQMRFRIGVHVGDIIVVQGDNLFGDAVNVAARLEALAEPGGICVSGSVQDQIGTKLPVGFVDLGPQQVKNITQPIKAYRISGETSPTVPPIVVSSLPLPDKPSIAVLPFANMSGDPEQEYFADGMVDEIINALSRIRWLFVIARNSSFAYKGQTVDVKQGRSGTRCPPCAGRFSPQRQSRPGCCKRRRRFRLVCCSIRPDQRGEDQGQRAARTPRARQRCLWQLHVRLGPARGDRRVATRPEFVYRPHWLVGHALL
jgi:hypothetical protein